jgi:asparagine N-glycosylation enzyme membrane subunit Stt3
MNIQKIFKENQKLIVGILLLLIVILTIYVRTGNIGNLKDVTTGNYTLGPDLDPFLYLRNAQAIIDHNLTNPDKMWAAPAGYEPYATTNLMPWTMVGLYKILNLFKTVSLEYVAIILPVILFSFSVIFFFLFIQKLFSHLMKKPYSYFGSLLATLLYAVIPQMLHRTTAGIPEIESLGLPFFWLAFYFFISAWENPKLKIALVQGFLSGLFTGLMVWSWGGSKYIFLTISLAVFLAFFLQKIETRKIFVYGIWWFIANLATYLKISSISSLINSIPDFVISSIVLFVIIIHVLLTRLVFNKNKYHLKLDKKIFSILVAIVALIILASVVFGVGFVIEKASSVVGYLTTPFGEERVGLTVAENKVPYFSEISGAFGVSFFKINLTLFWFFFFGTIFIFYYATKHFDSKNKWILNTAFIVFLIGFIFSRTSSSSLMNGSNFISQLFYFGSLLLLIISIAYVYLKEKNNLAETFEKIEFSYILLIVLMFFTAVSMRGAIRLLVIISPLVIISSAFLMGKISEGVFQKKGKEGFAVYLAIFTILLLIIGIITYNYAMGSKNETKNSIPGAYQQQWQKAMAWVRESTNPGDIFVHWWDYGYWMQTIGQRPTVTDGAHVISFWDHTTARYLMTAENEETTLKLLKAHNVSYVLLDSTDVGKYGAFASIGSDETGEDRLGYIPTFIMDEKQNQELKNETIYVYSGGFALDQDFFWNNQLLPKNQAVIYGFLVHLAQNKIINVEAVVYYNKVQYRIPINYYYENNKKVKVNSNGLNAILYFVPTLTQKGLSLLGSTLFLSEKTSNSQFVRMYLLNETQLQLVHSQNYDLMNQINAAYGTNIEFLVANQLYGPIKIFKSPDLSNVEYHPEYLEVKSLQKGDFAKLDKFGK